MEERYGSVQVEKARLLGRIISEHCDEIGHELTFAQVLDLHALRGFELSRMQLYLSIAKSSDWLWYATNGLLLEGIHNDALIGSMSMKGEESAPSRLSIAGCGISSLREVREEMDNKFAVSTLSCENDEEFGVIEVFGSLSSSDVDEDDLLFDDGVTTELGDLVHETEAAHHDILGIFSHSTPYSQTPAEDDFMSMFASMPTAAQEARDNKFDNSDSDVEVIILSRKGLSSDQEQLNGLMVHNIDVISEEEQLVDDEDALEQWATEELEAVLDNDGSLDQTELKSEASAHDELESNASSASEGDEVYESDVEESCHIDVDIQERIVQTIVKRYTSECLLQECHSGSIIEEEFGVEELEAMDDVSEDESVYEIGNVFEAEPVQEYGRKNDQVIQCISPSLATGNNDSEMASSESAFGRNQEQGSSRGAYSIAGSRKRLETISESEPEITDSCDMIPDVPHKNLGGFDHTNQENVEVLPAWWNDELQKLERPKRSFASRMFGVFACSRN